MNGRNLTLGALAGLAVAGFVAQRRVRTGSRAEEPESLYAFRTSMEQAIGGFPEGKLPLSKWREGFLSRGVVQEQLDTRGFLSYLAERQRQGVKSLAKTEVIAWLAANPYGLLETWKGTFGLKTAAEQRASRERMAAMREAKPLLIAHGLSSAEADLLLAQEGGLAVSMGNDIVRWDRTLLDDTARIAEFSPNGCILTTGGFDKIKLWRVPDGAKVATVPHREGAVLAFSPDGSNFATQKYDDRENIRLLGLSGSFAPELATLPHTEPVNSAAYSPDGRTLATGTYKAATLWRVADGVKLGTLPHDHVMSVAFSPDGHTLATGGRDEVTLWRVADGVKLATLPQRGEIRAVTFSPDGRILATGGNYGAALWQVSDGTKIATFRDYATSVAFSPDGRTFAATMGAAVLWRVSDGARLATLLAHRPMSTVVFSPDGRTLAMTNTRPTGVASSEVMLFQIVPNTEPLARALLRLSALSGVSKLRWEDMLSAGYTGYRELLLRLPPRAGTPPFAGNSMRSHWVEPDVLVHARITLRPIKGKKGQALFADEIQSDWHQGLAGRKPNLDPKSLPPAPFVDEWEKLMLKRLLLYAAETSADALVLTDGATIAPLVDPSKKSHAGIKAFYDVKLVNIFRSLVQSLGGVVAPIPVKAGRTYKLLPGVRMTPALRARLGQGVGYWGRT